nr:PREDICTED: uncharacterized protein LOC107397448 isoform X2 [Tribolium castaneum]|eukprot:XP_015832975.1 PREDICTED: uncharacterized protein LOC107397448 isoform X2 [Tribolium castaneum]
MNVHIKKMYVTIATFSIMGVILSVSVIAFLFSFQGNFENRYIRITTLVFTMVTVSTHILYVGQLIEDAVYTTLKTVDWNNWNLENRKLYLIYLQNAQIIFSIKFTQDVSINYRLGFSMAKAIYSMISVMSKLRNVDYSKI